MPPVDIKARLTPANAHTIGHGCSVNPFFSALRIERERGPADPWKGESHGGPGGGMV